MFRSLFENSIDVVLLLNSANEIVYVSPSVTQTYGYQPEAITGTTLFDLLHAEDLIIARDALALSATDEIFGPSVVRIQHKDQSWKYVEVTDQPFSEDQSLLQLSVRDVTQLSRSSLAPREIEICFEEAFNATSSIASVTDVETGVYIKVNEAWVTNMGWSREEVIGKTAVQLGIWESDAHRKEITDNQKKQGFLKGYRT